MLHPINIYFGMSQSSLICQHKQFLTLDLNFWIIFSLRRQNYAYNTFYLYSYRSESIVELNEANSDFEYSKKKIPILYSIEVALRPYIPLKNIQNN